jgi:hypothetical protein
MKRVAAVLKRAEVPFALSGGYAAWARGGPEPDHDVDFMIPRHAMERAVDALEKDGLRVEHPPEGWLVKVFDEDRMVDLIHDSSGGPVDEDRLSRAETISVMSLEMPVLDPSDVVIDKLMVLHEHYCDLTKVLPVVRALREQVDWDRVRRETAESPFAEAALLLAERLAIVPAASKDSAA